MTLSGGSKAIVAGALVVTGGGIVVVAGLTGFVAGVAIMMWSNDQKEKSDLEKARTRIEYKRMTPHGPPMPGATGPVEPTEP